jgi:LuxR family transcriptional regulator, maltose regulon positive regulatory protein
MQGSVLTMTDVDPGGITAAGAATGTPDLRIARPGSRIPFSRPDSNPDPVLPAVKLSIPVPRSRSRVVARPRLVQALSDGLPARLTLVCAPTGWGKTTVVSEWATATDVRFVWVSLDPGDDEPLQFWRCVVTSIAAAHDEGSLVAMRRLRSPAVSLNDEVLPALVNDLAGLDEPLVLVIDDYHLIANPEIHEQIEYLLGRLPPALHLVLICSAEPSLRLGRMRAMGEVIDIGAEQLRFTDDEAGTLLQRVHGLVVTDDEVERLQQSIEGWVAGLNLAALSLRRRPASDRLTSGPPVDERLLTEYLWDEVVMAQPPAVREFLLRTAVLERFSGSLADALTGRHDGVETARELERANLFVVPLDDERVWFRYHHLFRTLLRGRLQRSEPALIPELHRSASAWYGAHGATIEAIDHTIAAGDVDRAATEIERHWAQLYSAGQLCAMVAWIDRLAPDSIAAHPALALLRAALARGLGRIEEIEEWLGRVPPSASRVPVPGLASSIEGAATGIRSVHRLAVGDIDGAIEHARHARELELVPRSPEHATAGYFLGVATFFDEPRQAVALLQEFLAVVDDRRDARHRYAMGLLAETYALDDEIEVAERLARCAMEETLRMHLEEFPTANQLHIALGAIALARDELDVADEHCERAVMLARRGNDRVEIAHALLWLAAARVRQGDAIGGAEAFATARELVPGVGASSMRRVARTLGLGPTLLGRVRPVGVYGQPVSAAELRVLRLMPGDLSYREIAGQLFISYNTVRTHARRVLHKLGASSRSEAVARARERGLL